jgi:hypothetical protein
MTLKEHPSYAAGNSNVAVISQFRYFKGHIDLWIKNS